MGADVMQIQMQVDAGEEAEKSWQQKTRAQAQKRTRRDKADVEVFDRPAQVE